MKMYVLISMINDGKAPKTIIIHNNHHLSKEDAFTEAAQMKDTWVIFLEDKESWSPEEIIQWKNTK